MLIGSQIRFFTIFIFLFFIIQSFAQNSKTTIENDTSGITQAIFRQTIKKVPLTVNSAIPNKVLEERGNNSFSSFSKQLAEKKKVQREQIKSCVDSSFSKIYAHGTDFIIVAGIVNAKDGGEFIFGAIQDVYSQLRYTDAFITKLDQHGNILWVKTYKNNLRTHFGFTKLVELSDGSLIATGVTNNPTTETGTGNFHLTVCKLTNNGNLTWEKTLNSKITEQFAICQANSNIEINSVSEGKNGDLILSGTNYGCTGPMYAIVFKMDTNGNVNWDANIMCVNTPTQGIGALLKGDDIVMTCLAYNIYPGDYTFQLYFNTLDYNTGKIKQSNNHRLNYDLEGASHKDFSFWSTRTMQAANGHYYVYGTIVGYSTANPVYNEVFAVAEFDNSFSYVGGYTIGTNLSSQTNKSNYNSNTIHVDEQGKAAIMYFTYPTYNDQYLYNATIENGRIIKSKRVYLNDFSDYAYNGLTTGSDGALWFAQTFTRPSNNQHAMELRKLYNSDTSQNDCFGKDTAVFFIKDLKYITYRSNITEQLYNQLFEMKHEITVSDNYLSKENGCAAVSSCDTVKIHGKQTFCGVQPAATFTAYKGAACGAAIEWNIDTGAVNHIIYSNDTTISFNFKKDWNGKLYAKVSGGSCRLTVTDSLEIHVQSTGTGLNLGADTLLCSGNIITLQAGDFNSYRWQDGSTKPYFNASKAGSYYVDVTDYCGNRYSDTVKVATAMYPFTAGRDTIKCNKDSIVLTASDGFINYHWQPAYNLANLSGNPVKVSPDTDTDYIASAEKFTGCFVSDTVHISVLHSPELFIGNDTSLCFGNTMQLDAGKGFSTYNWSTGENTGRIDISQKGIYTIKAIASNGCASYDTLTVLNVYPLPQFSLGNDTMLCGNKELVYNFVLSNASYLWNNGSRSNLNTIYRPGSYWLAVTQQGCTNYDSIVVSYQPSPAINLGNDTTLCEGIFKQLDASNINATYIWQDNSTAAQYIVEKPGLYHVTATINSCTASDSIHINYIPAPRFDLGKDVFLCKGAGINLSPALNTAVNYLWQDGTTKSACYVNKPGVYTLTASNRCGILIDSVHITSQLCKLMMPSAFTPNKDGLNDVFKVKYPFPVKQFDMTIYNRFGQKVFQSHDISKGWNGTINNIDQDAGTYIWKISLTDNDGIAEAAQGTVTMIR